MAKKITLVLIFSLISLLSFVNDKDQLVAQAVVSSTPESLVADGGGGSSSCSYTKSVYDSISMYTLKFYKCDSPQQPVVVANYMVTEYNKSLMGNGVISIDATTGSGRSYSNSLEVAASGELSFLAKVKVRGAVEGGLSNNVSQSSSIARTMYLNDQISSGIYAFQKYALGQLYQVKVYDYYGNYIQTDYLYNFTGEHSYRRMRIGDLTSSTGTSPVYSC